MIKLLIVLRSTTPVVILPDEYTPVINNNNNNNILPTFLSYLIYLAVQLHTLHADISNM